MNAIEKAQARNLIARARLANIKKQPAHKQPRPGHRIQPPTKYELSILQYLSNGLSQKMTADAMNVGFQTIKTELKIVRFKLQAKNTTHAVAIAVRGGLIH